MRAVLALVLALLPAVASAVTVPEIVALSKAGVSDGVILALIVRDKTIFTIDPQQLVALKRDGVSEDVVLAMLKSGRQEPAAAADVVSQAASAVPAAAPDTIAPETIVVGHGPDRPNTFYEVDGLVSPPVVPYLVYVPPPIGGCAAPIDAGGAPRGFGRFMSDPTARFLSDPSRRFVNNGWINGGVPQPLVSNCLGTTVGSTPLASAAPARAGRSFRRR